MGCGWSGSDSTGCSWREISETISSLFAADAWWGGRMALRRARVVPVDAAWLLRDWLVHRWFPQWAVCGVPVVCVPQGIGRYGSGQGRLRR